MVYVRSNVWELGGDWADPILWYARGMKAMRDLALDQDTGWGFYGAIHGMDAGLWQQLGIATTPMPAPGPVGVYWDQCQHGSWYFLPWHRGYLLAFEQIIRAAVVAQNGPSDWALPYWNYFKANQNQLPPAFASPDWPDGKGDNPLYFAQRYGPKNDGNVYIPMNMVNEKALNDRAFIGAATGASPGFGGVQTGFSHQHSPHGGIESQPHDQVHVLVGGSDPKSGLPGLMSDPDTAGLDPIFWLHHANIDRLWEVWLHNAPTHQNPTQANWLNGPASIGQRAFAMPLPGGVSWTYTPAQMGDLTKLDYKYDDVTAPAPAPGIGARLQRLGATPALAAAAKGEAMAQAPQNVELLGANDGALNLVGAEARTSIAVDPAVRAKVSASLTAAPQAAAPDRVFLNLENIRGLNDATIFNVYVNAPEGEDPAQHPENLAGSVALFGVRKASRADTEHAGDGLTYVLEITDIIDALHLQGSLTSNKLDVRIVPLNPVPESAKISIGRVSVFRQAG
jgi:tyrosinase